ncbi:hypothetical protein H4S04_006981, partial [Coemansia sp. S16]
MIISVDNIIASAIDEASSDLRKLSLTIHDNPELALEEKAACQILVDYLETSGFEVQRNIAGLSTAFVCTYVSSAGAH